MYFLTKLQYRIYIFIRFKKLHGEFSQVLDCRTCHQMNLSELYLTNRQPLDNWVVSTFCDYKQHSHDYVMEDKLVCFLILRSKTTGSKGRNIFMLVANDGHIVSSTLYIRLHSNLF